MLRFRLFFGTLFIVALIGLIVADDRLGRSAFAQDAPAFARAVGLARLDGLITVAVLAAIQKNHSSTSRRRFSFPMGDILFVDD